MEAKSTSRGRGRFATGVELRELGSLPRHERQMIYASILKESGHVMTPSMIKEALENRGMTFGFVGQDMAAMRLKPFVKIESRGQYQWNEDFVGEISLSSSSNKKSKVEVEDLVMEDHADSSTMSRSNSSSSLTDLEVATAREIYEPIVVLDHESRLEKERAIRNLDDLFRSV